MAQIKGNLLLSRLKFLNERATPEQKVAVLNNLTPDCKKNLTGSILAVSWYPLSYSCELMEAINKVLGQGQPHFIEEIGRFSAQQAYRGLYKLFFKFGSPEFILRRCPVFWSQLVDKGKLEVNITGQRQATLTLTGFDQMLPHVFVRSLCGWTQGLLEVSGAKSVQVELTQAPDQHNFDMAVSARWEE